uniref:Uncharacterized protein n=1 Tax=Nelumbo nucifera TaxID=4432 RepID=A0A822YJW3_NELNU|nr:TPA_asm: hypothetical protein HUJ06_011633 [Nelumbo nucifera]
MERKKISLPPLIRFAVADEKIAEAETKLEEEEEYDDDNEK